MTIKLGPHYMMGGTGLSEWLAEADPTTVKFCFSFPRDATGNALVVGRAPGTDHVAPEGDPVARARALFAEIWAVARANPHITTWEGANEPAWSYKWTLREMERALTWYGIFDYTLAELGHARGLRMVIGNWATTTPGRTGANGENINDLWGHYRRGLQATADHGAIIGRHDYGPLDETFALRHRADYRQMHALGYPGVRMLLTEVGAENVPGMTPWRNHFGGDDERYFGEWLRPFELAIRTTPYVIGAHLFTLGDGADRRWHPYDVAGTTIPQRMAELSAQLGPIVAAPPAPAPARHHIVVSGDTLSAIGRRYGLLWRDIAAWNGIVAPYIIRPGQRLTLTPPAATPPVSPPAAPPREWSLRLLSAAAWGRPALHAYKDPASPVAMVPASDRDRVVIHHTVTRDSDATPNLWETEAEVVARLRAIDAFHRGRGFGGVGYSYLFAPMADRTVLVIEGRGDLAEGIHAGHRNFNWRSIGLAVLGDYRRPFDAGEEEWRGVMAAVNSWLGTLRLRLPHLGAVRSPRGLAVWGHREVPGVATVCPGPWLFERLSLFTL